MYKHKIFMRDGMIKEIEKNVFSDFSDSGTVGLVLDGPARAMGVEGVGCTAQMGVDL